MADTAEYCFNLYGYDPSKNGSIVALVSWALVSSLLLGLTIRGKNYYLLVVPLAGFAETFGYLARIFSGDKPCNLGLFIAQGLLILVPPTCLAMGNYTLLSRLMQSTGIKFAFLTPSRVKYVFLVVDICCLLLQTSGGGMTAQESMADIGQNIALTGIVLVMCLFTFFLILVGYIHYTVRSSPGKRNRANEALIFSAFYLSMVMIIIRSVYRVAEYAGGFQNSIATNEKLFYACDCLPLLLFMIIWIALHPSHVNYNLSLEDSSQVNKVTPEPTETVPLSPKLSAFRQSA